MFAFDCSINLTCLDVYLSTQVFILQRINWNVYFIIFVLCGITVFIKLDGIKNIGV